MVGFSGILDTGQVEDHGAKTDFDIKLSSLNRQITSNKSKHLLIENELKKLKEFSEKSALGILSIFL